MVGKYLGRLLDRRAAGLAAAIIGLRATNSRGENAEAKDEPAAVSA